MNKDLEIIEIPKEKAVFRMDGRGRWCNSAGPFQHKKTIAYFNSAIDWDEKGYFVSQNRGNLIEKVYFPYEDTALFVVQINFDKPRVLVLNTGRKIPLDPEALRIQNDHLYQLDSKQRIKFSEHSLIQLSPLLEETPTGLAIRLDHRQYVIQTDKSTGRDSRMEWYTQT